MRSQSLAQMALQVRQRADLDGQQNTFGGNGDANITDVELTSYLNSSVTEIYNLLVLKYGENYFWGYYFVPIVSGQYYYPLPYDCMKPLRLQFNVTGAPGGWSPIRRINIHENQNTTSFFSSSPGFYGWQSLTYEIEGQRIHFGPENVGLPTPIRLQYVPAPPLLCAALPLSYAPATTYQQGAQVYVTLTPAYGNPVQQVFTALNAGTSGSVGIATIGSGTAGVTYTAVQAAGATAVTVTQATGGVLGVTVTGTAISVTTGTSTASAVAALINGTPAAAALVSATGGAGAAVSGSATLQSWILPGLTTDNASIQWSYTAPMSMFATTFDGIAGWEDLVILDAAIKCATKQEMDISGFMAQRQTMLDRIEAETSNRVAGDPMVVTAGYGAEEDGYGTDFGDASGGYY
jgi:hypothetical protein